jgi:alcohol dehydrogenase class IV
MSRYARIARTVGLPGNTDKQLTDSLVEAIRCCFAHKMQKNCTLNTKNTGL